MLRNVCLTYLCLCYTEEEGALASSKFNSMKAFHHSLTSANLDIDYGSTSEDEGGDGALPVVGPCNFQDTIASPCIVY